MQELDPDAFLQHLRKRFTARKLKSLAVAFSGGLDSTVLLHLLNRLQSGLGGTLRAMHVHHGLHPEADDWADFCHRFCREQGIDLAIGRLDLDDGRGNVEERARNARYAWFAGQLAPGETLATAQHADDQAETVLLQLMRGAGLEGLSGMGESRDTAGLQLIRPLLTCERRLIRAYAERQGLDWVHDPGNLDRRFDRNYLRHEVMPLLRGRWPSAVESIARSGRHLADAARILDEESSAWLAECPAPVPADPRHLAPPLSRARLNRLDDPRLRIVLRRWWKQAGLRMPESRLVERIVRDLVRPETNHGRVVRQGVLIARYRDGVYLQMKAPAECRYHHEWTPGSDLGLDPDATLVLRADRCAGVGVRIAEGARCVVHNDRRDTSGRMADGHHKDLRKLYQEIGLPPWMRPLQPILTVDEEVAAIPGYYVFPRFRAAGDESAWRLRLAQTGAENVEAV